MVGHTLATMTIKSTRSLLPSQCDRKRKSPESKSSSDQDQERLPFGPSMSFSGCSSCLCAVPNSQFHLSGSKRARQKFHSSCIISAREPCGFGGVCVSWQGLSSRGALDWLCAAAADGKVFNLAVLSAPPKSAHRSDFGPPPHTKSATSATH